MDVFINIKIDVNEALEVQEKLKTNPEKRVENQKNPPKNLEEHEKDKYNIYFFIDIYIIIWVA